MPKFSCRRALLIAIVVGPLIACSANNDGNLNGTTAGGSVGGSAAGGSDASSGSSPTIGGSTGNTQQGGSNSLGGVTNTGGSTNTGGAVSSGGGNASGGQVSSGGAIANNGGVINTGGTVSAGGTANRGGMPSTGGAMNTGGATSTGGARNTGGAASTGGMRNTGGAANPGGTTGVAGSTSVAGSNACSGGPRTTSIAKCVIVPPPSTGDYHQDCVDTINKIRWDCMCLPPLARWTEGEACADQMAVYDAGQASAHAGFTAKLCTPGGSAQCECPGWGSVSSITQGATRQESCLAMMWHEVDTPSGEQGHYKAMSNTTYTRVACGINTSATNVWALQNYSR